MIGKKLGTIDGLLVGTYDGRELRWAEGFSDGNADDNLEGLLLGFVIGKWLVQHLEMRMELHLVHRMG